MTPGLVLDRARGDDVLALAALEAACFSHPWTPAQITDELKVGLPGAVLVVRAVVGERKTRPCAWCAYRVVLDEMHVMSLAVLPAWRRRGIARFLLQLALRKAAGAGAHKAMLEVRAGNLGALALYHGLGFVRRGVRRQYYSSPVEDAIELECNDLPLRPAP